MSRRQVIELGGVVATAAVVEAGVPGCSAVVREDVADGPATALPEPVASILRDAALAPSSHNSQPWRVVVSSAERLSIRADLSRALADVDPDARELRLSLGAFVENLVLAAGARGLAGRVDLAAGGDLGRPIAEIHLEPAPPSRYPLERLRRRCTVRRGLRRTALSGQLVAGLIAAAPSAVGFVPAEGPLAGSIREATLGAFRQQTLRDSAQRELARWIRFSNGAARAHRDGLTTASMGIGGLSGWFVRSFYDEDDVMKASFRSRSIDLTSTQVREAGGWFIVVGRGEEPGSIVDAGRAYERLALLARERGVGLHPMSQALEEEPYRAQLLARLGRGGVPHLIVRAGLIDAYPEPATLRRRVSAFASLDPDGGATRSSEAT